MLGYTGCCSCFPSTQKGSIVSIWWETHCDTNHKHWMWPLFYFHGEIIIKTGVKHSFLTELPRSFPELYRLKCNLYPLPQTRKIKIYFWCQETDFKKWRNNIIYHLEAYLRGNFFNVNLAINGLTLSIYSMLESMQKLLVLSKAQSTIRSWHPNLSHDSSNISQLSWIKLLRPCLTCVKMKMFP